MMYFNYMPFGWIFMVLFWGCIIWGIFALAKGGFSGHMCGHGHGGDHGAPKKDKTPLEILQERYARGEIDKAEFEEKKKDLQ